MNYRAAIAAVIYWALLLAAGSSVASMAACVSNDMPKDTALGITGLLKQDLKHKP